MGASPYSVSIKSQWRNYVKVIRYRSISDAANVSPGRPSARSPSVLAHGARKSHG